MTWEERDENERGRELGRERFRDRPTGTYKWLFPKGSPGPAEAAEDCSGTSRVHHLEGLTEEPGAMARRELAPRI